MMRWFPPTASRGSRCVKTDGSIRTVRLCDARELDAAARLRRGECWFVGRTAMSSALPAALERQSDAADNRHLKRPYGNDLGFM